MMKTYVPPELVIRLSKKKLVLVILGTAAFVGVSIWIWLIAESQDLYGPRFLKSVALVGGVFFGFCGCYAVKKVFDTRPGLIIDSTGIVDNSSSVSAGRIRWCEISAVRVAVISGQKLLVINLIEPQKYLARSGFLKRKLSGASVWITGSPINISSNSLCLNFDELFDVVTEAFERHLNSNALQTSDPDG